LRNFASYSTAEAGSSSSEWHHVPKDSLLGLGDGLDEEAHSIMRGCDAVVTTLNINDNTIDPTIWARTFHAPSAKKMQNLAQLHPQQEDESMSVPKEAIEAIQATHRWSSNFVRRLALCPWAGSSLDTLGAIRYWILLVDDNNNDNDGGDTLQNGQYKSVKEREWDTNRAVLDKMEDFVREAGNHLEQITSNYEEGDDDSMDPIDPSVAISFVILVDRTTTTATAPSSQPSPPRSSNKLLPDFSPFHDFFLSLEDQLLDECDAYWDDIDAKVEGEGSDDDDNEPDKDTPLGCEVTIAAFHPQWKFGQNDNNVEGGGGEETEHPIDFEKRTPYPTISCVMSSAIDALMNEKKSNDDAADIIVDSEILSAPVTERIAALNEKTLEEIGVERLREVFKTEVLQCPIKHNSE